MVLPPSEWEYMDHLAVLTAEHHCPGAVCLIFVSIFGSNSNVQTSFRYPSAPPRHWVPDSSSVDSHLSAAIRVQFLSVICTDCYRCITV